MVRVDLQMSSWAASKFTPGKFLGSTGANILSVKQLQAGGNQAWARKVNRLIRWYSHLFIHRCRMSVRTEEVNVFVMIMVQ